MEPKKRTEEHRDVTVWGVHLHDASNLTTEEREELLHKLNRIFTFLGTEIPEETVLDGQPVALQDIMWRLINHKEELTPEECSAVKMLFVATEKKIREIESEIRTQDIDESEALALYAEAQGLIRAAVELRDIEKQKMQENQVRTTLTKSNEAQKRWLSYLQKIR
jgi:hypothetical protein